MGRTRFGSGWRLLTLGLAVSVLLAACSRAPNRVTAASPPSTSAGDGLVPSPSTGPGSDVVSACGEAQVFFASGSSDLDGDARARLDRYADCLSREEIDTILVSGMTDPGGDAAENLVLGEARARSVADYLRSVGCDVAFVVRSVGEVDAIENERLWPIERAASATGVASP